MTQTKEQVSAKAQELVALYFTSTSEAAYLPGMYNGPSGSHHDTLVAKRDEAESALLAYIASLEADAKTLARAQVLIEDGSLRFNGTGVVHRYVATSELWQSFDTLREAIDAPSTEEVSR